MTDGPSLAQALAMGGWTTTRLDLTGVADKDAFMARVSGTLELPGWFGRNWDALADCLTDLSWAEPARGRLLLVTGWRGFAEARPHEWQVAQEVFSDAADYWRTTGPALEVVLALGGSDEGHPAAAG
ncbi:barstar family protein [Streptomyces sp. NPDC002004]